MTAAIVFKKYFVNTKYLAYYNEIRFIYKRISSKDIFLLINICRYFFCALIPNTFTLLRS